MFCPEIQAIQSRYADSPVCKETNIAVLRELHQLAMEVIFSRAVVSSANPGLPEEDVSSFLDLVSRFFPPKLRSAVVERETRGASDYRGLLASGAVSTSMPYYSSALCRLQDEAVQHHPAAKRDTPILDSDITALFSILEFLTSTPAVEGAREADPSQVEEQSPAVEVASPESASDPAPVEVVEDTVEQEEPAQEGEGAGEVCEEAAAVDDSEDTEEPQEELDVEDAHGESDDLDDPEEEEASEESNEEQE